MSTNPADGPDATTNPGAASKPDDTPGSEANRPGSRRRRILRSIALLTLAGLIVGAVGIGGMEYYTSRPTFCGTCHVMDPYYESWSHDMHGTKLDVWCVECHYAPGEQHTIKAKFKGLSQVASYFSGRYGASRPRAHVDDASCMRSNCHGDGAHLEKSILIGEPRTETRLISGFETQVQRSPTVRFVHAKHLDVDARRAEARSKSVELATKLKAAMSAEGFAELETATRSIRPVVERRSTITDLLARLGLPHLADDAIELMRLEHEQLRLAQLEGINCAACHTYDESSRNHFFVNQQTCFVCHFTNQEFNRHTGECLTCHEPPTRSIAVHSIPPSAAGTARGSSDPQIPQAAMMNHLDIINRGIDCASCHLDVIHGDSQVSVRDCARCHDQQRFMVDFERRDTRIVEEYHRVHVAGQRAKCQDCHRSIEHRLIDPQHVGTSSGFLQPIIQDCQHCHPNHHSEQVHLLMGVGGKGVEHPMPNAMFGSRLNCRACHTEEGSDFKGDVLIQATQATCVACHSEDYRTLFDQWVSEIASSVAEVDATLQRVDARQKELAAAGSPPAKEIERRIEQARANLQFVRSGNGIHNKNYALQLLDISLRDLDAAMAEMTRN